MPAQLHKSRLLSTGQDENENENENEKEHENEKGNEMANNPKLSTSILLLLGRLVVPQWSSNQSKVCMITLATLPQFLNWTQTQFR